MIPAKSRSPLLWTVLAMICAASMAYYVFAIWSANQPEHFSDLYAPWWGAHELLLSGRNPYSPQVAHEIQKVIYGRALTPSADDPSGIGGGFAYPPYAALLLWPLVNLPFATVQMIVIAAGFGITLLSLSLWLRVLRSEVSRTSWVIFAFFLLGSFPVLQAIRLQNLSILAAGIVAVAVYFVFTGRLIFGGIFLALATFKPQFMPALIVGLALWTVGDWRRRRSLAWTFLAVMLCFVAVSEWMLPGWGRDFLRVVREYRHYTYGHSLFDVWFSTSFGWIAALALLIWALGLVWRCRRQTERSDSFPTSVSLLLAVNIVIMPSLAPHAQLLLLPGFLCLLQSGPLLRADAVGRSLFGAAWILLIWEWIGAAALLLARIRYPANWLTRFWQLPLYSSAVLPLAVAAALGWMLVKATRAASDAGPRSARRPTLW